MSRLRLDVGRELYRAESSVVGVDEAIKVETWLERWVITSIRHKRGCRVDGRWIAFRNPMGPYVHLRRKEPFTFKSGKWVTNVPAWCRRRLTPDGVCDTFAVTEIAAWRRLERELRRPIESKPWWPADGTQEREAWDAEIAATAAAQRRAAGHVLRRINKLRR